jgi:MFS family permease
MRTTEHRRTAPALELPGTRTAYTPGAAVIASGQPTPLWGPLRVGVFRALWLAVLVSNVGLWMQTVGAQWLLLEQAHASVLVALVQTADMLPNVLFGVVGGVLADTLDRRRLLIAVQTFMVITAVLLTVLTAIGQMPPALLLTFTFLLGSGSVLSLPAYQSLVPQLVPRSQIAAAATLSSVSINLARAIGPALAGILIARVGVAAVFGLNAATFLFYGVVVAFWHPPLRARPQRPEHFVAALRTGGRYVRYSPVTRRVMLRAALFLVPGSALWALLPLVATQGLGQGASGYGLLLAALGIGAVAGSFALPYLRSRLTDNLLTAAASVVYAAALAIVVLVPNVVVAILALLPAGIAWIAVLSTMNAALQLFLPAWVRARGLSIYLTVFFGSQALGAVAWGAIAVPFGLRATFLIAAAVMAAGAATYRVWQLIDTSALDRSPAAFWPEPQLALAADPDDGPVVVRTVYTIEPDLEEHFLRAMARVRRSRLRTGATQWGLFRDGETPQVFVELFVVVSWDEHTRQHTDRFTADDQAIDDEVKGLSDPVAETSHLIAADVEE